MYDEFIKRLREKAEAFDYDGWVETASDYEKAADAIEELNLIAESNERSAAMWAETAGKAVEQIPRWISVTERLPEEDTNVLCFTSGNEMFVAIYMGIYGGDVVFDDCEGSAWLGNITHWMPLPEPPKEE